MTLPGFRAKVRAATVLALGFFPHLVSAGALALPVLWKSRLEAARLRFGRGLRALRKIPPWKRWSRYPRG